MITKELTDFIKTEQAKNIREEDIKFLLIKNGWSKDDVDEAYKSIIAPVKTEIVPPVVPVPHKKHKALLFSIILIILLVIAGGSYAYLFGYFTPLEQVTSKALDSAVRANSASFDTTIKVDLSDYHNFNGEDMSPLSIFSGNFSLTSKGSYNKNNKDNIKFDNILSFELGNISGEVKLRLVDNTLYGILSKAPVIGFIPTLSQYENKWFSFPFKNENASRMYDMPLATFTGFDSEDLKDITAAEKEQLYKITQDAKFIKITEKLAPEKIVDTLSYHFLFELDKEGIRAYLQSLKDYIQSVGKDSSRLSAFDPKFLNEDLNRIVDFKGEAWIGKKDNLLRKIEIHFRVKDTSTESLKSAKVSLVSIFNNWNENISVIAPLGSVPFETFMKGAEETTTTPNNRDSAIKSKMSEIRAQAEIFYDSPRSYKGVCASPEFKVVESDLTSNLETVFKCLDSKDKYVALTRLFSHETYCTDSTGFLGIVIESPEIDEKLVCNP